jgi:hypothetical protein
MKKPYKTRENIGCIIYILISLIVFGVGFGLSYLIAESSLPFWVKFWLLG